MSVATGSVLRSPAQKLSERVSVLDFGAKGDGITNDTAAINAGIAYCAPRGKELIFPAKLYFVSNLATFTVYNTILVGEPGARLKFTGTGAGIATDGSANIASGVRVIIRDLILDGNGSLDYCIDALLLVGGELKNIRCTNCKIAGVRLRYCVLNLIDSLTVSVNVEPFSAQPVSGIILDSGPTAGTICGGNTLLNPRIEGVSGPGIDLAGAQTTTILGGSSEGNGRGLIIRAISLFTTVMGLDCESNSVIDLDVSCNSNDFYNCSLASTNSVHLHAPAMQNHFFGGFYRQITLDPACRSNVFDYISCTAAIEDNGDHNVFQNILDPYGVNHIRNKQWADQTFTGRTSLEGGVDSDLAVTGDVNVSGAYKVNGTPISISQTPLTSDIDAANHKLNNVSRVGVGGASAATAGILITASAAAGPAYPVYLATTGLNQYGVTHAETDPTGVAGVVGINSAGDNVTLTAYGPTYATPSFRKLGAVGGSAGLLFTTSFGECMRLTTAGDVVLANVKTTVPAPGSGVVYKDSNGFLKIA